VRAPGLRGRAVLLGGFTAAALVGASLISCGPSPPAPSSGSRPVSFTTGDGVELRGRLFEADAASAGIVLAPAETTDQTSWFEQAESLADDGYRTLTFDFRGACQGGTTCPPADQAQWWRDVRSAVAYVRSLGSPRVAVVGAGAGGTAALVAAAVPTSRIAAVATVSAPISAAGVVASPELLATAPSAKLFMAGNGDASSAADAQSMYDLSLPPKRVEILPSADRGAELLQGNQGPNARAVLASWLARFLPVQAPGPDDAA
jgi:pimeloyl-ACP methyl ester carboxylesterase